MTQHQQSFIYHSLHRHVQSIIPQNENKDYPIVYSSNKQPQLPSVLERSRQKKSHQKSLKKGISRVSKSKKDLYQNTNQFYSKQVDTGKTTLLSKGTLLNFNIQQVVENKYHLTKPKDEVMSKSPLYTKIRQQQRMQKSAYEQGQRSFINQYRIVTYVPPGYMQQQTFQSKQKSENFGVSKQLVWDKQNNLNESNIKKGNFVHKKNESQQIQITNPIEENSLQLNTWRTTENNNNNNTNDYYYTMNYKSQLNKSNIIRNESSYIPFQERYSIPLAVNVQEVVVENNQKRENNEQQLKQKMRHLQHEIVDMQREKGMLLGENQELKMEKGMLMSENQELKMENGQLSIKNERLNQELESFYQNIAELQDRVKYQEQQIINYKHQLSLIEQTSKKLSESQLYQQQQVSMDRKNNNQNQQNKTFKIQQLQLLNGTLSKQLSEKSLIINELNRKNLQLSERLGQVEKLVQRGQQLLDDKRKHIVKKNQAIQQLNREIQNLKNTLKNPPQQNHPPHKFIPKDKQQLTEQQSSHYNDLKHQFQQLQQKYQQKLRDYNHLEKKHHFMKDQLQHLKYLQNNASSSYKAIANVANNNNNKNQYEHDDEQKSKYFQNNEKYLQQIKQLQKRLQITQRNLSQVTQQYSNLKDNFRALQQLYIKQQQQLVQSQRQLTELIKQNKALRVELTNLQELSKTKTIQQKQKIRQQNESIRLIEKDQVIIGLKRELNSMEMGKFQLIDSRNYLRKQLQELNQKYLKELQKNTQFSIKYKQDIAIYTQDIQKQQQQKTSLIVQNYETLITKLNQQITYLKQQIETIKDKHFKQLYTMQNLHLQQLQKIKKQRYQREHDLIKEIQIYQNKVTEQKFMLQKYHPKNIDHYLNQQQSTKELQILNKKLEQECNILSTQCNSILREKDKIEDNLRQNIRKLAIYEQDIAFYKNQTEISVKEKLQLSNQLQKVNRVVTQLKKVNNLFQQERFMFNRQLDDLSLKYTVCLKENESFIQQVKTLKKRLTQKQFQQDDCESQLREMRISLLEEKQLSQTRLSMIEKLKLQVETYRSKEEYYKMMYEKTQQQLLLLKQQNSLLILEKEKLLLKQSLKSSPIKRLSPVKNILLMDQVVMTTTQYQKTNNRETQLYRIEIYKDINALLNLTLHNFTLQEILQNNQQQYLRKLFNAVKDDHHKLTQLKQLIVHMEQQFKQQKILIKKDYDLVYEKYLKYKSMSQSMEKDIEKYKLKLKKKDENFASIKI